MKLSNELIADYALSVSYDDLPEDVIERTKRFVLDSMGCAFGGFASRPSKILRDAYGGYRAADGGATVFGTGEEVPVEHAALINSAMVRYLDYNDAYLAEQSVCHPSDHIGALIPVAEAEGATGEELVEAIVVGYEIQCRGVDTGACFRNGFDYVAWMGFSMPAAAGKLMGLSKEEMVNAIGIAGASNNGILAARLSEDITPMWKGVAAPYANHNAIEACGMARRGMGGPTNVFESPGGSFLERGGWFRTVSRGEIEFDGLGGRDGAEYRITDSAIKPFPAEYMQQAVVTAVLDIVEGNEIDPDEVEEVYARTYDFAIEGAATPDKWSTDLNREHADHSLPYVASVAIIDGEVTTRQFTEERVRDERVHEMMGKVVVEEDEAMSEARRDDPRVQPAYVRIDAGGERYERRVDHILGQPERPMSDGEIEGKVADLAEGLLSEEQLSGLIDACYRLDRLEGMDELLDHTAV